MDFDDIKNKATDLTDDAKQAFDHAKDDISNKADDVDDKTHQQAGKLGGEAEQYRRDHDQDNDYDQTDSSDSDTVDNNATTSSNLDRDVF